MSVDVHPEISVDDTPGALAAVTSGLKVTSTTSWVARPELREGALERLFPDRTMAPLPVHAFLPMGRAARIAPRVFVEFLRAELKRVPPDPAD